MNGFIATVWILIVLLAVAPALWNRAAGRTGQ